MHPPQCPYRGNASDLRASGGCIIKLLTLQLFLMPPCLLLATPRPLLITGAVLLVIGHYLVEQLPASFLFIFTQEIYVYRYSRRFIFRKNL